MTEIPEHLLKRSKERRGALAGEGQIFIGGGAAKGGIRVHGVPDMKKPPEIALGGLFGAVLNANQP